MLQRRKYQILRILISIVWLVNGLFCKVLNLVSRHQEIVARILGDEYVRPLTLSIGLAETGMAVWIISGVWTRLNAITQIIVITAMNTLEIMLAPDLLLWGRINAFFALLFIILIYYNEFYLNRKLALQR